MSVQGEIRKAFSGRTMDIHYPKEDYSKEIIAQSRAKYCTPIKEVETLLNQWDESGEFTDKVGERPEDQAFEEPLI